MPYILLDGRKFCYDAPEFDSHKRTFIFLHGLGGSMQQTKAAFTRLPGNWNLVYADLRGHGGSALGNLEELSFEGMASDIYRLMRALNIGRAVVGGISMGAAVTARLILDYPESVQAAILIRSAWLDRPMRECLIRKYDYISGLMGSLPKAEAVSQFLSSRYYKGLSRQFPANAASDLALFDAPEAGVNYLKYKAIPRMRPFNSMDLLSSVRLKALIIGNRHDPAHPYNYSEAYHSRIAGSELYEIPSKNVDSPGHYAALNELISGFLAAHTLDV